MGDMVKTVKDWIHDHVVNRVDVTSGEQTPAKPPKFKTPPGEVKMGTGIASAGQNYIKAGLSKTDQAIRDAGG